MVCCRTWNVFPIRQFCRFFYCFAWFDTVEFNRLPCPTDKMYDSVFFAGRFLYQLAMFDILYWYGYLDSFMLLLLMKRYCQNHRRILPNFLLFVWFETVEFNRQPCSNDKMYDDVVFPDRFCYQLTMFEIRVLVVLSRLLHAFIAYVIDTANIIAEFCRISYCLYDLIWLYSIACRVHTTRCTMM